MKKEFIDLTAGVNEGVDQQSVTKTEEEIIAAFFANLGMNGGKVFEVDEYNVTDNVKLSSQLLREPLKAWKLEEIKVTGFSLTKNKGYITINPDEADSFNIPIINLSRQRAPFYKYNKDEAIEMVIKENAIILKDVEDLQEELQHSIAFYKSIVKKDLY